jgi:hypothetical protein
VRAPIVGAKQPASRPDGIDSTGRRPGRLEDELGIVAEERHVPVVATVTGAVEADAPGKQKAVRRRAKLDSVGVTLDRDRAAEGAASLELRSLADPPGGAAVVGDIQLLQLIDRRRNAAAGQESSVSVKEAQPGEELRTGNA